MKQFNHEKEYQQGVAFAILCSSLWGSLPIYWKSLESISPLVILFYRLVLSSVFALILALIFYKWKGICKPFKQKGLIRTLFFAGLLISINWGLYIWAVNNDHIIQTSIGYYIEPLIICVFGLLFFKERMNRYKVTAFLLACTGVGVLLFYYHQIPTIALVLACSFAVYSVIKKKVNLDAVLSLLYETMFLVPPALIIIFYFELNGKGAVANATPFQWGLLALAGIITGLPLMLFTMAANRINLITLGIIQYISPSITLLLAIFLYREPFEKPQLLTFSIIWTALAIFTFGEIKEAQTEERFRFAGGIKRVTAGPGGEVYLIIGSEKTAVLDCGMAFCGTSLVENIKRELKGSQTLDYILLSHTHYDHMGGLPYLKQAWPEAVAVGAPHAKSVFESQNALETIRKLSLGAEETYKNSEQLLTFALRPEDTGITYRDEDIKVDLAAREGDRIDLGNQRLKVMETPGHTNCSLSFFLEEKGILFAAETMGCFTPCGDIIVAMLKGYQDTVRSLEKGKRLNPQSIVSPHYGRVPDTMVSVYWDRAREAADNCRKFILDRHNADMTEEEILTEYREEFWHGISYNQQPLEAFDINAKHIIHAIIAEGEDAVQRFECRANIR